VKVTTLEAFAVKSVKNGLMEMQMAMFTRYENSVHKIIACGIKEERARELVGAVMEVHGQDIQKIYSEQNLSEVFKGYYQEEVLHG
jgi:hypothetical protein